MRSYIAAIFLATLVFSGCNQMKWFRPNPPMDGGIPLSAGNPTAEAVVACLNDNARRIQSLESKDVDLTCTQGQSVNLRAFMACEKPRNFRLRGQVVNNTIVDMGSNGQEFWWWIGKADPPYLYHCTHEDFSRIQGRVQLPFQPDWVMEALGMSEYDPRKDYQLLPGRGNTLELVENALSPQGRPVRKVTVLTRTPNSQIQINAHLLKDEQGREICSAYITQHQRDNATNAVLPRTVELRWPAEQIKMKMVINEVQVNREIQPQRTVALFTRPLLKDVPTYDLLRGLESANPALRPVGGLSQK
jgi:hypothetical protein